jgi:hypothetical protein
MLRPIATMRRRGTARVLGVPILVVLIAGCGSTHGGDRPQITGSATATSPRMPTGSSAGLSSAPAAPHGGSVQPGRSWWRPSVGTPWQWQLSGSIDLSLGVGVYDLDLVDTTASTVAAVHARGAKAICYLETGGWESYRPDAGRYPVAVLGKAIGGYPDERYLDLRQRAVLRPIIDARLDVCVAKGFDGVEPDIDDSVPDVGAAAIGFPVAYADQLAFNQMVVQDAHARHLAIGLKNGVSGEDPQRFVADMLPMVDFAVNEECVAAGDVCEALRGFPATGKPVFHAEYLTDYPGSSTSRYQQVLSIFCPVTQALRFSSILKDASASLSAWRASCP